MTGRVDIKGRFARSVRLDADAAEDALDGYLPTGRSLDVLRRFARGMSRPDAARAFSITGPYGSGKSSLAVLLDALLSPADSPAFKRARAILRKHAPDVLRELQAGRKAIGAERNGFVRAVITAPQREPVATTVLRALVRGTERAGLTDDAATYTAMLDRAESPKYSSPTFLELRKTLEATCARMPVLVLIDEFGKNLEAYADAGGNGDLYLLQDLAELTQGSQRLPLIISTIQHLAFEAYAADASAAQRREWAKVQGRLEDVPFLDSPAATRRLIAAALVHDPDPTVTWLRHEAAHHAAADAASRGTAEVAAPDLVAACWPLHPSVLLVLPDLCARYGQNERTLFSFLASDAPSSAKSLIADTPAGDPLPWVRLDAVYDYFVESSSTFVGASRDASRWIEIETTIRDAHGLTQAQRRLLKTIGVFNLVAATGTVRASRDLLAFALSGADDNLATDTDVQDRLTELADLGIVVHRDFAGEYRIWQGSDFDLDGHLTAARRRATERSPAALLNDIAPLGPIVAARHAIEHGTIRAFDRHWTDTRTSQLPLPAHDSASDGLLLYVADPDGSHGTLTDNPDGTPVVTVTPGTTGDANLANVAPVAHAALEVAALHDVASDTSLRTDDHAVRRELSERLGHARQVLATAITDTYGPTATWKWINPPNVWTAPTGKVVGTSYLSAVLDAAYHQPWTSGYEAINRAELSSAGARARRVVLNAITDPTSRALPALGLTGAGPEVAIYRSVLVEPGLLTTDGTITPPHKRYRPVWDTLMTELDSATSAPITAAHLLSRVMASPHGLRAGVAGLVVVAALLHRAADIAVYEHGTFKHRLDGALIDRLVRNPRNFAVKHLAASDARSTRGRIIKHLAEALDTDAAVLPVTKELVRLLAGAGKYLRTSKAFHLSWKPDPSPADQRRVERAVRVRDAILAANQPDELLFIDLPAAIGMPPALVTRATEPRMSRDDIDAYVTCILDAATLLRGAHAHMIDHIAYSILQNATRTDSVTRLTADAEVVAALQVAAPDVRTFAGQAMLAGYADTTNAWVSSLATACTGVPPANWTDHDIGFNVAKLTRIASDFRRLAYLATSSQARQTDNEPFTAWMISATPPDGRAIPDLVVAVHDNRAQAGSDAIDRALIYLADTIGITTDEAFELLAGSLVSRLAGAAKTPQSHPSAILHAVDDQPRDDKGRASV